MSGRKPRKDELDLWAQVARTARARPDALAMPDRISKPEPRVSKHRPDAGGPPASGLETSFKLSGSAGKMAHDLVPDITRQLSGQPVSMDRKRFRTMQRGKLKPDARIDLHGMTLDRAHTALTRFVLTAQASHKRLLLVITGKGKHRDAGGPIPVRHGVLRHQVPEWLRIPPLSTAVLQVTQAHISHGGEGAYYVYLRKPR